MTEIRLATTVSDVELCRGMAAAFADYALPMQLTQDGFDFMMRQRGVCKDASFVALDKGELAAIWLVSVEGRRGYLISSGTLPHQRGRGLAQRMGVACLEKLRADGAETFQTEVMAGNTAARALYDKLGLSERRLLDCYDLTLLETGPGAGAEIVRWDAIAQDVPSCRSWAPSWQNDDAALQRVAEDTLCLAVRDDRGLAGYAAVIRPTGVLAQVAVLADRRRQGLASGMLRQIKAALPDLPLRVLNAAANDQAFGALMLRLGARRTIGQSELFCRLHR